MQIKALLISEHFSSTPLVKLLFPSEPPITQDKNVQQIMQAIYSLLIVDLESAEAKDTKL